MPEPELDGVDGEAQSPSRIKFLREWGGGGGRATVGDFSSAPCQYDPRGRMLRLKMIDCLKSSAKGHAYEPSSGGRVSGGG